MPNALVNSIYPVSYFALPGVDEINYPDNFWWSSKSRPAAVGTDGVSYVSVANGGAQTAEVLELDLGRIREVNYLNFDVLRAPIDVQIEYDVISTPDREAAWLPVKNIVGQSFDSSASFDANNRTAWLNAEFNFTDPKGNMVHTRYLRITFTRRDDPWPTSNSAPFAWPVFVKHLRLGRNITTYLDTVGPLFSQDTPNSITEVDLETLDGQTTREARQRFVIPTSAVRAGVTPKILGFGVLIDTEAPGVDDGVPTTADEVADAAEVVYGWSVWDVTNDAAPVQIIVGEETGAVSTGLSWLDWYLDVSSAIPGDTSKIYELRVFSKNVSFSDIVYAHSPNVLSNTSVPGTLSFTNNSTNVVTSEDTTSVVSLGDYISRTDIPDQVFTVSSVTSGAITLNIPYPGATTTAATASIVYPFSSYDDTAATYVQDATKNLVMRVWADVADEGRDVLGNAYRYVTRNQDAASVFASDAPGWMSDPSPSPDAVEALYFDVRGTDPETGDQITTIIEALQVAPRTPGVRMNVYYSQQNLKGDKPVTTDDWDYLLWTPIQETYTLRRDEIIEFPQAIRAAYVKLEFTSLNPLPYRLPTYPTLPPKLFRRFPTWVEDQFNNSQVRNVIEDWFLRNATPVETQVLASLSDPVLEFEYKQKEFLSALALGEITDAQVVNSGIVDIADKAIIDPTTATKIYVSFDNQYQNTLLLNVDQTSVLGQMVVNRYDPTLITDQNEKVAASLVSGDVPFVSTTNNRVGESYQNLVQVPMRFNKTSRHVYTIDQAEFNKKAYFVGIQSVRFLRNNYTVVRDDSVIPDDLYDDEMLTSSTFVQEEGTQITDGTTVYVTYSTGTEDVTDEVAVLAGFNAVPLQTGGAPVRNVFVFSQVGKQGLQFFQNQDYELSYGTDSKGARVSYIQRSSFGERLMVPLQAIVYVDAGVVIGRSVIPSTPTDDAAVVTGVAAISDGFEGPPVPTYNVGRYGTGNYGDLFGALPTLDSDVVIGVAKISSVDTISAVESATAIGHAVVSGTEG